MRETGDQTQNMTSLTWGLISTSTRHQACTVCKERDLKQKSYSREKPLPRIHYNNPSTVRLVNWLLYGILVQPETVVLGQPYNARVGTEAVKRGRL